MKKQLLIWNKSEKTKAASSSSSLHPRSSSVRHCSSSLQLQQNRPHQRALSLDQHQNQQDRAPTGGPEAQDCSLPWTQHNTRTSWSPEEQTLFPCRHELWQLDGAETIRRSKKHQLKAEQGLKQQEQLKQIETVELKTSDCTAGCLETKFGH